MAIVTPGVKTATELAAEPRSPWLGDFAAFAAKLTFADLPAEVVERTKRVIADSIGAIAAGMAEPEMRALLDRLARLEGTGPTPVIGAALSLSPSNAAFMGGIAGTMLELDEGNQYARGHPGIHVVPAALATAARLGRDGRDLIVAVALGYEIGARIGIASKLVVTMHPHGTWGTVGAALAVAKLHKADAADIAATINIASSLGLTTSRKTMLEGATIRNSYAGFSNKLGLWAWEMMSSGLTGERDGVATVYDTVAATDFRPEAMTEDLGTAGRSPATTSSATPPAATPMRRWMRWARSSRPAARSIRATCSASTSRPMSGPRSSTIPSRAPCWRRSSRCPSRWPPPSSTARRPSPPSATRPAATASPGRSPTASPSPRTRR